jgi:translation initiation factor IF-1
MSKKGFIEKVGVVIETLPDGIFKVRLEGEDKEVMAYLSGKMRKFKIFILLGDKVKLEFSEYDSNMGRITYRLK